MCRVVSKHTQVLQKYYHRFAGDGSTGTVHAYETVYQVSSYDSESRKRMLSD